MTASVGILGGTGSLGQGLATRFSTAGLAVRIGSRDATRAAAAAAEVTERVAGGGGEVVGGLNVEVTDTDVVVVAVPFAGLAATVPPLASALAGQIVVSAVNPVAFDRAGPHPVAVPEGSAAQQIAAWLPDSRVTAAFHTISGHELADPDEPLDDDVPVLGDDEEALATVVDLADRVAGLRGVPVGPLRLAATLEGLTAVLISINRRHRTNVGVRFSRL